MSLTIEMLPAAHGDCLWIEHAGDDGTTRILVDGGPEKRYGLLRERIEALPPDDRQIDLLVITHVDTDHIDGIVRLLLDELDVGFGEIWFNGRTHVHQPKATVCDPSLLGGAQGNVLGAILLTARYRSLWNTLFNQCAVVAPETGDLPAHTVGPLTLTLLSPGYEQLSRLVDTWDDHVRKTVLGLELINDQTAAEEVEEALRSGNFDVARAILEARYQPIEAMPDEFLGDSSKANGSSIAFLLETPDDHAVLLAGDAHDKVLARHLSRLLIARDRAKLPIDAFKLPHHGSRHNLSPELLNLLECPRYLFSTDGSHGFDHPNDETIDMILDHHADLDPPEFYFNYRSHRTIQWLETDGDGKFVAIGPAEEGDHGLTVGFT